MLRIPAVLLYHDIRRGEEGVDQRHVGSHHQNTGCQASSPLHSNNERNPIVWVCWIYHNLSLCQAERDKRVLCAFCNEAGGGLWTMHNTWGPGQTCCRHLSSSIYPLHTVLMTRLLSSVWGLENCWWTWTSTAKVLVSCSDIYFETDL